MATSKELRRRIKSIKNTSQITKAMQMVSATKMRKAQNQALSARPYTATLIKALSSISDKIDSSLHPLLSSAVSDKVGVVIFSTDKGLCGALNTNITRKVMGDELGVMGKKEDIIFYTIGRKGRDFLVRTGKNLEADFPNPEKVDFAEAVRIRKYLVNSFLNGETGEIFILYPDFISALRQEPKLVQLLPVSREALMVLTEDTVNKAEAGNGLESEFVFEPNAQIVLEYALLHLIDTQIYQAMLETKASEHSARMMAMQNATDNAKELVGDLSLVYNQMRQGAITTELLEITSAAAALE